MVDSSLRDGDKREPGPATAGNGGEEVPWRTEGLAGRHAAGPASERPGRWWKFALGMLAVYLAFFALLSFLEQSGGRQTVPYTEFTAQVQANGVAAVFSRGTSIEGNLRLEKPLPGANGVTYRQFVTERPAFATDDLPGAPEQNKVTVRATPVVQERGVLTNLLTSVGLEGRGQQTTVCLGLDPL